MGREDICRLTIGQLAHHAGVGIETIRFYERLGLIDQPAKPAKGYRRYGAEAVAVLSFIQAAKRLGFTLRELQELKGLLRDHQALYRALRDLALQKLKSVDARRHELSRQEKSLRTFLESLGGGHMAEACPILMALNNVAAYTALREMR